MYLILTRTLWTLFVTFTCILIKSYCEMFHYDCIFLLHLRIFLSVCCHFLDCQLVLTWAWTLLTRNHLIVYSWSAAFFSSVTLIWISRTQIAAYSVHTYEAQNKFCRQRCLRCLTSAFYCSVMLSSGLETYGRTSLKRLNVSADNLSKLPFCSSLCCDLRRELLNVSCDLVKFDSAE